LANGLKEFVDTQVISFCLGANSEHVRGLIRNDQQQLRSLLLAGAQSAPADPVGLAYFDSLRKRINYKNGK
jgi:antitoxin ParD1/3/4